MDQTPYSLEVGIEILEFFEEYFNITYPLPKQGIKELKKKWIDMTRKCHNNRYTEQTQQHDSKNVNKEKLALP